LAVIGLVLVAVEGSSISVGGPRRIIWRPRGSPMRSSTSPAFTPASVATTPRAWACRDSLKMGTASVSRRRSSFTRAGAGHRALL